jgi:hypothetical protein
LPNSRSFTVHTLSKIASDRLSKSNDWRTRTSGTAPVARSRGGVHIGRGRFVRFLITASGFSEAET